MSNDQSLTDDNGRENHSDASQDTKPFKILLGLHCPLCHVERLVDSISRIPPGLIVSIVLPNGMLRFQAPQTRILAICGQCAAPAVAHPEAQFTLRSSIKCSWCDQQILTSQDRVVFKFNVNSAENFVEYLRDVSNLRVIEWKIRNSESNCG